MNAYERYHYSQLVSDVVNHAMQMQRACGRLVDIVDEGKYTDDLEEVVSKESGELLARLGKIHERELELRSLKKGTTS